MTNNKHPNSECFWSISIHGMPEGRDSHVTTDGNHKPQKTHKWLNNKADTYQNAKWARQSR